MILDLPHRKLDELLLVLQTCTYRRLLGTIRLRTDSSNPATAQVLRKAMMTRIATTTLAYKSTSQKVLEVVMACRQELVPTPLLATGVRVEVKSNEAPLEGRDNLRCTLA
jgi:hypothetical protein